MIDFSGSFQVKPPDSTAPLDLYTSIDVTQLNDFWVAWAFASGTQSGLQEMKKTKIVFAGK
jgi:hypothetical protein